MCLFNPNKKLIAMRKYFYLYGTRYSFFSSFKEGKTILVLDIVNHKSAPDFKIINSSTKEEKILANPSTGIYKFELYPHTKYQINIKSNGAIGSYKIFLEKK
jgi:hypothetical protein